MRQLNRGLSLIEVVRWTSIVSTRSVASKCRQNRAVTCPFCTQSEKIPDPFSDIQLNGNKEEILETSGFVIWI